MWIAEFMPPREWLSRYLPAGAEIFIGRKTDSDISFPEDKSVSRSHATITVSKDNQVMVTA